MSNRDLDQAPVSVVIPCLNSEATILTAIASVKSQYDAKTDLEIICVNDGSTDATCDLLSKLRAGGSTLLIQHSTSRGASAARNVGLKAVTREYVQFLDVDDILLPGKLRRQVRLLRDTDADFVVGAYEDKRMDGSCTDQYPDEDCWAGLLASRLGRTSSNLFRTKTLNEIGGWNESQKSSQEYELMFRLLVRRGPQGRRVAFDNEVGTRKISTRGSISNSDPEGNAMRYIQLRRKMLGYLQREGMLTEYRRQCYEIAYRRSLTELSEKTKTNLALSGALNCPHGIKITARQCL